MATLKVYQTRIGFHDVVVAAPNQKAALDAWDVRENLFAHGAASVSEDGDAVKAATAHPGAVLSRPAGSDKPFTRTAETPQVPRIARPKPAKNAAPVKQKPPPDRRLLDAAEKALAELDDEERDSKDEMERRRRELDSEASGQARAFAARRRKLEKEHDQARRAYERAGGRA